jgi:uncharacterized membrane protein YfcA
MKIRQPDLDAEVNAEHIALGIPPLETDVTQPGPRPFRKDLLLLVFLPLAAVLIYGLGEWLLPTDWRIPFEALAAEFTHELFWQSVAVGLLAQVIDGALGMAYGITATTFLLSTGVSPAVASASVHISEIFTTAFSGISHWRFGNVDKHLFKRLLIPGIVGAVTGAWVLTSIDGNTIKPWISAYLLLMGLYILSKAIRHVAQQARKPPKHIAALALTGGFVDSVGGGGWGPVVTTSLLSSGMNPRTTIGSVNAAEFFLSIAGGVTFAILVGFTHWQVIAGLVVGGLFAAPFAAWLCQKLPARALLSIVGVLITCLSIFNLWKSLA